MARKFFVGPTPHHGIVVVQNGTVKSNADLVKTLNDATVPGTDVVEVVVAPAAVHITQVKDSLRKDFEVAAQNSWVKKGGAFTGELSAEMLKDLGLKWVILGHSERRHIIKEADEFIADKVAYALGQGLGVIYCIGEKLEEREAGQTLEVNARQMQALIGKVDKWDDVVIAYEPVWAIGTGKVATPEQAEEVHASVRDWISKNVSPEVAESIRIIYGGSVTAANCNQLAAEKDIDGFLVGGASLKPEFVDIIKSATTAKKA
ncbi:hypothetical protein N2152v2_002828 [Parachlorella kessleri]